MKSLCAVRGLAALLMVSLLACVPPVVVVDGGHDAGVADAGVDAGTNEDAGSDAGDLDAGLPDAGDSDAGAPDAGPADAGDVDAGVSDAGAAGCPVPTGGAPFTLRVMAANLTSGNLQSYDPGEGGLTVRQSYFDRTPYVEENSAGQAVYVEHHRTLGDRVRELVAAGLVLLDLVEPEWPEGRTEVWGQWSPLRGALMPGTAIFVAERREGPVTTG